MDNTFVCEICHRKFMVDHLNEHHKIPKSLGGSDDPSNISKLCHAHHDDLHLIAYAMINPKRVHNVEKLAFTVFPTDLAARKRLLEFSTIVAKEMSLKKELPKDPKGESRVILEIPTVMVQLLRLTGYDNPHANGKPKGVSRIITEILVNYLCQKFPAKKDLILSSLKQNKS